MRGLRLCCYQQQLGIEQNTEHQLLTCAAYMQTAVALHYTCVPASIPIADCKVWRILKQVAASEHVLDFASTYVEYGDMVQGEFT